MYQPLIIIRSGVQHLVMIRVSQPTFIQHWAGVRVLVFLLQTGTVPPVFPQLVLALVYSDLDTLQQMEATTREHMEATTREHTPATTREHTAATTRKLTDVTTREHT